MTISSDNYRSRVKGLRDFTFGGKVTVFKAGADGKPDKYLRTEKPNGEILTKKEIRHGHTNNHEK